MLPSAKASWTLSHTSYPPSLSRSKEQQWHTNVFESKNFTKVFSDSVTANACINKTKPLAQTYATI